MSQTMMPPGGAPGGGGGMPQLPPQVLQMLMQRMQGGGMGGPPGMAGPGSPPPGGPPGAPPGGMAGGPPPSPPGGMPPGAPPPIPQPGQAAQLAQQGRFGDSIIAHVTPGEISVPPQIQTPQLIAALQQAFARAGVSLPQFTAGSPQTSHNPATGAPELSLWSALLPILGAVGGGVAGSVIPGLGTAAGAALGGGLGGAAGGLADHQSGLGVGLSALGGAAGGYFGAPAGAAGVGAEASSLAAEQGLAQSLASASGQAAGEAAPGMLGAASSGLNPYSTGATGLAGNLQSAMPYLKTGLAAGTGAGIGGALAPPTQTNPLVAAGFNRPLPPLNPNFNQLRGAGTVSSPQFTNYNPYTAVTGGSPGYNFFPPSQ
jgi:hypothetical protein